MNTENYNVDYYEAKENLNQYDLEELQLESKRFEVNSHGLTKEELIEAIIKESDKMGLLLKSKED